MLIGSSDASDVIASWIAYGRAPCLAPSESCFTGKFTMIETKNRRAQCKVTRQPGSKKFHPMGFERRGGHIECGIAYTHPTWLQRNPCRPAEFRVGDLDPKCQLTREQADTEPLPVQPLERMRSSRSVNDVDPARAAAPEPVARALERHHLVRRMRERPAENGCRRACNEESNVEQQRKQDPPESV